MAGQVNRIEFSYSRSDLRHPDSKVKELQGDHIVWWHSFVQRTRGNTIPLVKVQFRKLYDDVPGPNTEVAVPLSSLPHYSKGSIWRDGKCISDTQMDEKRFKVDFSPGMWSITSRAELYEQNQSDLFSDAEYPLKYKRDRGHLLNFKLANDQNLLIPCTEYFIRAYARHMDVCRAIVTLLWSDIKSVFYDNPLRSEHGWVVNPTAKVRDYDAVFLAHLLYDDYTEEQVRLVNAQFTSQSPTNQVFLRATPWFTGPGELLCRGKWINKGNTFLCLHLVGSTEPKGKPIEWLRPKFDNSDGEDEGRLVMPKPVRTAEAEEFLTEESYAEPDGHAETMIVKTPPFQRLGEEREVKKDKTTVKTDRGRLGPKPPEAESHSSGDGAGAGKNIGKLDHVADAEVESHGFLRDIWNALKSIGAANPSRVSKINWYIPGRFRSEDPPRVILLDPIDLTVDNSTARNWVFLDRPPTKRRGMMILRIEVDGHNYFCFEIQRTEAEEKAGLGYAGALVKSHVTKAEEFDEFVNKVCSSVRFATGRFKHMKRTFPVDTKIFTHKRSDQKVLYRRCLVHAFEELDVFLK